MPGEECLLRRLKAHDHAAFEELTRQYEARIYNLHCWMTGDRLLAQDLTQETFLAIWRGIDGFQGKAKLLTWIHRIARNVALQHIRKRTLNTVPLEDVADEIANDPVTHAAEREMLRDKVREALAELPQEQREALVLNKMSGLSHPEVARILDRPLGTVKWHIAQALQSLRLSLRQRGVTNGEV